MAKEEIILDPEIVLFRENVTTTRKLISDVHEMLHQAWGNHDANEIYRAKDLIHKLQLEEDMHLELLGEALIFEAINHFGIEE